MRRSKPLSKSQIMARVKSRDTGPEVLLRKALWRVGRRYRVQFILAGTRIDIAFPRQQLAVFVDGCFWHGCPEHYRPPPSNQEYWRKKLESNLGRDRRQSREVEGAGWQVMRFWECAIRRDCMSVVRKIVSRLDESEMRLGDDQR